MQDKLVHYVNNLCSNPCLQRRKDDSGNDRVRQQTFTNFELTVINDGSTENTVLSPKVARRFARPLGQQIAMPNDFYRTDVELKKT